MTWVEVLNVEGLRFLWRQSTRLSQTLVDNVLLGTKPNNFLAPLNAQSGKHCGIASFPIIFFWWQNYYLSIGSLQSHWTLQTSFEKASKWNSNKTFLEKQFWRNFPDCYLPDSHSIGFSTFKSSLNGDELHRVVYAISSNNSSQTFQFSYSDRLNDLTPSCWQSFDVLKLSEEKKNWIIQGHVLQR